MGDKIGNVAENIGNMLAGRESPLPRDEYDQLYYAAQSGLVEDFGKDGASDNFGWVAAAYDTLNAYLGKPTVLKPELIPVYVRVNHLDRRLGLMQKESFGHYAEPHILPAAFIWQMLPVFVARGIPGWAEIEDELLKWLRAVCAWHEIAGVEWASRELGPEDQKVGPRVLRADSNEWLTYPFSALSGQRGTVWYQQKAWIYAIRRGGAQCSAHFALGLKGFKFQYWPLLEALEKRNLDRNPFTQPEIDRCWAARRNDLQALNWLVSVANEWASPGEPYFIARFEGGVAAGCLRAPGSSTATIYGTSTYPDGVTEVLVADPGHRDSSDHPWIVPGSAVVNLEARTMTAKRDDADDSPNDPWVAVTMKLPPGKLLFYAECGPEPTDPLVVKVGASSSPEPIPADDEQPTPGSVRCADWLSPAHLMGGCAGPGYYCAILPTQDSRVFILVKQNAPYTPAAGAHQLGHGWGLEGLIVKPDGSVCISYEATFGPDGALRHERCFYDNDLKPGYPWLPATLPVAGATPQRTLSGWTVERHVSDGPGWRFPVGSVPMRPGETRTNKAVARCVFEHLGVRVIGGVPVAVISRYDRLGQEPRVNQEWYEFGASAEGALGYLSHQGIEYPDVDANDVEADRMEKFAHSVCVRMMGPDGKIRAYATPNYGPIGTSVEADAPRPVLPRSERKSWWDRLLEFLGF